MIDVLLQGKLQSKPQTRVSKNGKEFVTCRLVVAARDGESFIVSLICFEESVSAAIVPLDTGDAIAVCGEATPKAWLDHDGQPRAGLSVVVKLAMSAYQISKKRKSATIRNQAPQEGPKYDQWQASLPQGSGELDF